MIELVVAVCMIDQPSHCKDVHLNFEEASVTPHQCLMYGQIEMAKWVGEHPNWIIQNWHCGVAGQMAKI
ncbi:MAG: hypothetical protein K2X41_09505 [Hyphomicrobium sp.]|nr:hypothetical protein [Hyphomicrobium sp.]